MPDKQLSDHEQEINESSYSDDDEYTNKSRRDSVQLRRSSSDFGEMQGSVEGPINPVNYSGTQINVWGFPSPDLVNYLHKPQPQTQVGFLTENMIKVICYNLF